MRSWKNDAWLALSVRTTGPHPARDRIVELGAVLRSRPRAPLERYWLRVFPDVTDPHLWDLIDDADVIVIYDMPRIAPFLERYLGPPWTDAVADKISCDPRVLARDAGLGIPCRGCDPYRIEAVAHRLRLPARFADCSVIADCELAIAVLWRLRKMFSDERDAAAEMFGELRARHDAADARERMP